MYAIIDIETTGGNCTKDKITEIAIFIHNGNKIVDEYTTLINPEVNIPYFITQLTGITNAMVAKAPKFYEVAKKIVEITTDKIFIAHNASFDYNFIVNEFKNLGFDYNRKVLCTVKLSRKIIPGYKSYSLGNICKDLGFSIKDRHRAAGDALATVKLLEYLLLKIPEGHDLFTDDALKQLSGLHPLFASSKLKEIPEETGVYYFYNEEGELIYVGKSKNIYSRVLTHFSNNKSERTIKMKQQIADVTHEITGSELIALLKESDEIKKFKPFYNRKQKNTIFNFGIYCKEDENGYLNLSISKIKKGEEPVMSYETFEHARTNLARISDALFLCQKLTGQYESAGACFNYNVRRCKGACVGEESTEEYNQRVQQALAKFEFDTVNFFVIDKGKSKNERSVVKIENSKYQGFGCIDITEQVDINTLHECIQYFDDNRDVRQIIRNYLIKNKVEKIVKF